MRFSALQVAVLAFALGRATLALGQADARVLLVTSHTLPNGLRNSVTQLVGNQANLIDPQAYAQACARAGVAADSVAALESVAPQMNAQLIVLAAVRGSSLRVSFREPGASGRTIERAELHVKRGGLDRAARSELSAATRRALEVIGPADAQAAPAGVEPELAEGQQPEQAVAAMAPAADGGEPEPKPEPEPEPEPAAVDSQPTPTIAALTVGSGIGQRQVSMPTSRGEQRLDSGAFPVIDVRVAGEVATGSWLFGAQAHYQTSVGVQATTTPPNGAAKQTTLRLHHLDIGLTAGLAFSDASDAVNLRLFAGWGFRGLRPVTDLDIPPYTLHGPVARLELRVPIAGGVVLLRIAPELFGIVHVSDELVQEASSAHGGLAFGGEIDVEVRFSRRLFGVVGYRESRARVSTAWDDDFADDERFGTLAVGLRY